MKRLSDIPEDEAFELMAEIGGDISAIQTIPENIEIAKNKELAEKERQKLIIANIFKYAKTELKRVLLAVDDTPITAANLYMRTLTLMADINSGGVIGNFSDSSEQTKTD